jgi:hypothetical protein
MIAADHNAIADEPRIKTWSQSSPFHGQSDRNPALAAARLLRVWRDIHLQPIGPLLVF